MIFQNLCGRILHLSPLSYVDSAVNELLAEKIRLKSHFNMIANKGILYIPLSIFDAPIYKVKYQGRIGLGNDECSFCKEKCPWKSQCPKMLRANKKNSKSTP